MEINHRSQDKYLAQKSPLWIESPDGKTRDTDFLEIEIILKDIRFIVHEMSSYDYLEASELSFGGHLNQKYWEFLSLKGEINQHDIDELEEGVLLIIYLLYGEIFEAEGACFLNSKDLFEIVNGFVDLYNPDNKKKQKMKECLQFSIDNYRNEKISERITQELDEDDTKLLNHRIENDKWMYKTFVADYFINLAKSF
ncbi:MAG: hypothetical protein GY816_04870 [Cytophagales bacterium]|nr:hypothetical protein [Cytophagales bacterium]